MACQKSSSDFWRSLVFAQIVRFSSAHSVYTHTTASVTFCRSLIHQASAAECTCFFSSRSANHSFTLANLSQCKRLVFHLYVFVRFISSLLSSAAHLVSFSLPSVLSCSSVFSAVMSVLCLVVVCLLFYTSSRLLSSHLSIISRLWSLSSLPSFSPHGTKHASTDATTHTHQHYSLKDRLNKATTLQ